MNLNAHSTNALTFRHVGTLMHVKGYTQNFAFIHTYSRIHTHTHTYTHALPKHSVFAVKELILRAVTGLSELC